MIDGAKIRAIFMGTPDYAIPILSSLISKEIELVSVYTRPDKPRGRGNRASVTPIKCYALKRNIPVSAKPKNFHAPTNLSSHHIQKLYEFDSIFSLKYH